MSKLLDDLITLLSLETVEENIFRGNSQDLGFHQLYGGQVLGQALSAASQTVDSARQVHSLHGYFLRRGDACMPVVYLVESVRDGGAFSNRKVTAVQKGRPIFTCSASFQAEEPGLEQQSVKMPDVPGPEGLENEQTLIESKLHLLPERIREKVRGGKPIEIRPVSDHDPFDPHPRPAVRYTWVRADGMVPDIPSLHRYLLAYASDFSLLTTALLPHGISVWSKGMQVASIDHSIWFHRQPKMDEWMLFAMEGSWTGNSRGLSQCHIFSQEGVLIASACQEGLIRRRTEDD